VTYLRWQDYLAWSQCPGRPALEESEGGVPDEPPRLTPAYRQELDERTAAYKGAGATVELLPLQALDVGAITGERGAIAFGSVILSQVDDHAALEVVPADKILGLAALVKYSILHAFVNTNVGTPEELYQYGQEVTEAGQLSLNLRMSVTALEHLVPGAYCKTCRSAYRCPALTKDIHEEVFGPLEALEDPEAAPVVMSADQEWSIHIRGKVPMIEAWLDQVKDALDMKEEEPAPRRRRRKKSKKPARHIAKA
jgi:hypothetical protein